MRFTHSPYWHTSVTLTRDICITSEISLVLLSYNKQRMGACESGLYWHESMKRGEPEANGRGVVFI